MQKKTPILVDDPKVSLTLTRRLNISGHKIAEVDRARSAYFLANRKPGFKDTRSIVSSIPTINQAVAYSAEGDRHCGFSHLWA